MIKRLDYNDLGGNKVWLITKINSLNHFNQIKSLLILFLLFIPCLAFALTCTNCGKAISGKYFKSADGNLVYCETCYSTLERCAMCGKPESTLIAVGNKKVCGLCYNSLKRCSACGDIINGKAWKAEGDDRLYCDKCHNSKDICDVCGVPLPSGQGFVLDAARKVCERCKETSVFDPKEAEQIYAGILEFASKELKMTLKKPVPIKMVTRAEIKKAAGGKMENADRLFGLWRKGPDNKSVLYFLSGTPRYLTRATIAHEWAHAWADENCVKNQEDEIAEGFAEWFAWKVLYHYDEREGAKIIEDKEDVYGRGFRFIRHLEEKSNPASVIMYVKSAKSILKK